MNVQVDRSQKILYGAGATLSIDSSDGFNGQYDGFDKEDIVPPPSAEDVFYVFDKHRRIKKDIRRRKKRRRPIRLQKHSRCSHDVKSLEKDNGNNKDRPVQEPIQLKERGLIWPCKSQRTCPPRTIKSRNQKKVDQTTAKTYQKELEKEASAQPPYVIDANEEEEDDDLVGKEILTSGKSLSKNFITPRTIFPTDAKEFITESLGVHELTKGSDDGPFEMSMIQPKKKELGGHFLESTNLEDEVNYEFINRVQEHNRNLKTVLDLEQQQEGDDFSSHSLEYDNPQTSMTNNKRVKQCLQHLSFSFSVEETVSNGKFLFHMDSFSDAESVLLPDLICCCA